MPELPEVETVRRTLEARILGARVERALVRRRDVIEGPASARALLEGDEIASLRRRGKQLALVGSSGRVALVHLGMTGSMVVTDAEPLADDPHVHAVWKLRTPKGASVWMRFRDPRRFGGLWTLNTLAALEKRWAVLGRDGLEVTGSDLRGALGQSKRAVKAALLDQEAVAGVGNIYADEALFLAGINPLRKCRGLKPAEWDRLAAAIRGVLLASIERGGSTLRDFVDGEGRGGGYQARRLVYGRKGEPCLACGGRLLGRVVGGRATVYCPACQPSRGGGGSVIHRSFTGGDELGVAVASAASLPGVGAPPEVLTSMNRRDLSSS